MRGRSHAVGRREGRPARVHGEARAEVHRALTDARRAVRQRALRERRRKVGTELTARFDPEMFSACASLRPGGGSFSTEEELLDPPGFFGLNYPPLTVMGFFVLHVMFGLIVGVTYGALA